MSYGTGGGCPADLQAAVARAVRKGMILVASVGNTGSNANVTQFPSNCKSVVGVGACDPDGKPWADSQRQPYVAIGGPGVDIASYGRNKIPGTGEGTSFSAAIVSGEYALLRAHWPTMPSRQLVAKLFHATSPLYKGPGYGSTDDVLGFGIGVVDRALKQYVPANASNPVYDDLDRIAPSGGASSTAGSGTARSSPVSPGRSTVAVSFPGGSGGSGSGSSHTGLIVGIVVGVVVMGGIVVLLAVRRRSTASRS